MALIGNWIPSGRLGNWLGNRLHGLPVRGGGGGSVAPSNPGLLSKMVSYWTGTPNATSGQRNDDFGPNLLGFSAVGTTRTGKVGTATDFAGGASGNFLRTSTTIGANSHTGALHASGKNIYRAGWVVFDTVSSTQTIACQYGGFSPSREYLLQLNGGTSVLELTWCTDQNVSRVKLTHSLALSTGVWYFVAFGRSNDNSEIWLSVTPESESSINAAETLASTGTQDTYLDLVHEFGANDGSNEMDGGWNQWGVYESDYDEADLNWIFNSGDGRDFSEFTYSVAPTLGYFHDMEQDAPADDSLYTYQEYQGATARTSSRAFAGSSSLQINGNFEQIQIYNDSNTDYWATVDEGRVVVYVYVATGDWLSGAMVFQMDGKSRNGDFDTNDGIDLKFQTTGSGDRGLRSGSSSSGYNMPLDQWVKLDMRYNRNPSGSNYIEVYADDVLVLTHTSPLPALTASSSGITTQAWHHISLGNDVAVGVVMNEDNFQIFSDSLIS